jgi:hypothetical protein
MIEMCFDNYIVYRLPTDLQCVLIREIIIIQYT